MQTYKLISNHRRTTFITQLRQDVVNKSKNVLTKGPSFYPLEYSSFGLLKLKVISTELFSQIGITFYYQLSLSMGERVLDIYQM